MIKLELWQLLVFIFASIARSKCCLLSRGRDCPPQGAFFGGRIVFKGNRGEVPGLFADLANSRRMMILQTPPVHFRSLMGSGQGRIWIGSKTCRGSDSRLPEQCPWTAGDRPCPDTGIPCETELGHVDLNVETMAMETLLESRFIVSWQLPSLTVNCDVTFQQITLHQLDVDNCNFSPLTEPMNYVLHTGMRNESFEELRPNSLYNITYLARNPAGTFVTSQLKRTAEGIPTQAPINLRYETRENSVEFWWNIPECGQRNGEIKQYWRKVIVTNDRSWERQRSAPNHVIRRLNTGDEWFFKVRACNDAGCGPLAEATGVMT
ncbi:Receptor-type tyrosine-protein phosphatase F [Holothuria leucospilota]|uniref:Receptor-type tyrosine-protein phosphatase F n=1 Tax=Holothuria leucospilota TaxID=206669 RepID=A0A9Q0YMJ7_HOLLE|nr:Receptor-type tyrosine-protein phosphatase F [Holothuria leucospilota]